MTQPYLGEIRIVSFGYPPSGWAFCNGQLMPINQNQALFSILGTTYGGDGITTFALPDLQGRMPVHPGDGIDLGETGGETAHVLTIAEIPQHSHPAMAQTAASIPGGSPANAVWATSNTSMFAATPDTAMGAGAIGNTGGGVAHENRAPYLTLSFMIALVGVFPSRN